MCYSAALAQERPLHTVQVWTGRFWIARTWTKGFSFLLSFSCCSRRPRELNLETRLVIYKGECSTPLSPLWRRVLQLVLVAFVDRTIVLWEGAAGLLFCFVFLFLFDARLFWSFFCCPHTPAACVRRLFQRAHIWRAVTIGWSVTRDRAATNRSRSAMCEYW